MSLDCLSAELVRCRFNWQNGITGLTASVSVTEAGISVNCTSVTASEYSKLTFTVSTSCRQFFTACRKASFASAVYAMANPSITLWYCVKTRERRMMWSSPSGSPVSLAFWSQEWLMGDDPVQVKFECKVVSGFYWLSHGYVPKAMKTCRLLPTWHQSLISIFSN